MDNTIFNFQIQLDLIIQIFICDNYMYIWMYSEIYSMDIMTAFKALKCTLPF